MHLAPCLQLLIFFMMMKPWFPQNAPDPNLSRPVTSPPFADNATRVQVLARFLPTMAWNNTGTQYREQKLNFPPKFDACNFTFSWPISTSHSQFFV